MTQKELRQKKMNLLSQKYIVRVGSVLFLIPNLLFIFQGFSSRYWADDYCFSGFINEFGFLGGLTAFYSTTSNRFSAFIFASISELFGNRAIRAIPPIVIFITGFLLFLILNKILGLKRISYGRLWAFLFSQIILFFILYLSPNIDQSVYWRSGLTHYFLPLPLLLFLLMITFFSGDVWKASLLKSLSIALLACLSAGLSESYAALQFGLFSVILFLSSVLPQFKLKKCESIHSALVLLGTVSAMAIMILSPGNALRLDSLQQAPNFISIISISITSAFNFIKYSIRGL